MQFVEFNSKRNRRQQWQRIWPRTLLTFITIIEMLLTAAIIGLEFWSMIINVKYSFFFIGFLASLFFIITLISTFTIVCCCKKSLSCATYVLVVHILSIAASSVLLFYDVLFLRNSYTCLWPNGLCDEDQLNFNIFGIALSVSRDIHSIKFTVIKIQIICSVVMIFMCLVYIGIYIYTNIRVYTSNRVTDSHTVIELGRVQQPPPPYWPTPPKTLPPSSEF
ncbi:unnamed protein product [Rotaria magnacalcarata]|uniref:Uncharacterized protein n=1 Tax=Rotaria magnacalcarata TaxID=392030 RepID=A0A815WNA7_9BILA|nr:unnamed protein product [Rotaria magnacalcarata]CAF1547535.1 unnamed protein product [Rotaria magnacalcarata]CAF2203995.1 unnamed protein product [Rotaria magnacalcarata]CAF3964955.1 unnamed protein product [Rotaria magnacalcarata]CAF3991222.1 unnamed protein product [Rotaria magnacalcarata]